MHYITDFEKVLVDSGINYQSNKVIDDFLLTGKNVIRDTYRCSWESIARKNG